MSRRFVVLGAVVTVVTTVTMCHRTLSGQPSPVSAASVDAEPVHTKMHGHFKAVRDIHMSLLAGDLKRAQRHARSLTRISAPRPQPGWEERVEKIRSTAASLVRARSARRARRLLAHLANQCADCHEESADMSRFIWATEPLDDGSAAARMARHEWAAESVWLALIARTDEPWREGLDVLTTPPLLPEAYTDDRGRHEQIEKYARATATLAARARSLDGGRERAAAFAEILDACAGCHRLTRP